MIPMFKQPLSPVATGSKAPPHRSKFYEVQTNSSSPVTEIIIRKSDGDPGRWPEGEDMVRNETKDGQVDYLTEASERESKLWRKKIGRFLAKYVISKDGWKLDSENCYLRCFPEGYQLITRLSGDKASPRRDVYLYGSAKVFASPAEWCLHAKWLVEGCPHRPSSRKPYCECIRCDGTVPQSELSAKYDLNAVAEPSGSGKKSVHKGTRGRSQPIIVMAKDYTKLNTTLHT